MATVEEKLEYDERRADEIIDKVFSEENNDAPRYNPFFLLKNNRPVIEHIESMNYPSHSAF